MRKIVTFVSIIACFCLLAGCASKVEEDTGKVPANFKTSSEGTKASPQGGGGASNEGMKPTAN